MSETYEVGMFNGTSAFFNKETNLLVKGSDSIYIKECSQAVLKAADIFKNRLYKSYKPLN